MTEIWNVHYRKRDSSPTLVVAAPSATFSPLPPWCTRIKWKQRWQKCPWNPQPWFVVWSRFKKPFSFYNGEKNLSGTMNRLRWTRNRKWPSLTNLNYKLTQTLIALTTAFEWIILSFQTKKGPICWEVRWWHWILLAHTGRCLKAALTLSGFKAQWHIWNPDNSPPS